MSKVDVPAVASKWAFVPAADILMTVGEGMVGVTFEGAYVMDTRKRSVNGVWASVTLPIGLKFVDMDIQALVKEFQINDGQAVQALVTHCHQRPNTKFDDMQELKRALNSARDPSVELAKKLEEFEKRVTNLANKGKGVNYHKGGKGGGKGGKAKGKGHYSGGGPSYPPSRGGFS